MQQRPGLRRRGQQQDGRSQPDEKAAAGRDRRRLPWYADGHGDGLRAVERRFGNEMRRGAQIPRQIERHRDMAEQARDR
jgi:hypothetical protein